MAAYRWVDDLSHLRADCLYNTAISSGPNARYLVWEAFTFYLFTHSTQSIEYLTVADNLGLPILREKSRIFLIMR